MGRQNYSGRTRRLVSTCCTALLALQLANRVDAQDAAKLLDARTVLDQIDHDAPAAQPPKSDGAQLVADIKDFRRSAEQLGPDKAALVWFQLLDRITTIAGPLRMDPGSFDSEVPTSLGVRSLVAALPPPSAWPAMRSEAARRAGRTHQDYRTASVQLLAATLLGDRTAVESHLRAIDSDILALPPAARQIPQRQVAGIRSTLVKLYGTPTQVADSFLEDVGRGANAALAGTGYDTVEVPDLVGLVGEPRAAEILAKALTQPVALHVESWDATRTLVRRVALENIKTLRQPQWGLADSIDAAPLYEAMVQRFPRAPQGQPTEDRLSGDAQETADTYYLLFLIINGRQQEATKLLESLAAGGTVTIPKPALDALERAHRNDELYAFLGSVLVTHPEVHAWEVYIQQAAYTGHSREALAALDSALKRKDLPPYLRTDLQARRADALLAMGDTKQALPAYAELLKSPPSTSDRVLGQRATTAIRVAGIGRVLGHPELESSGLSFGEQALALPSEGAARSLDRQTLLQSLFAEARKEQKETEAQRIAVAELRRHDANTDATARQYDMVGMNGQWSTRGTALVELVSLYTAAPRPADARALLDRAQGWGARDLRDLMAQKDSQGVPLSLLSARVLAATGERATAIRIAIATIAQSPGYDAGYELEGELDPNAREVFAAQFRTDQFEARPLIWNAVLLARASRYPEAEQSVRAAIAIDPSDGNEGVNDRMRAYAVLADILEARGDGKSAAEYRSVVTAIRISERSDELHSLGLYQAAFAGYREALTHFSDAYCIQSRLAVQLSQQGQHEQAAEHYRRAYELMPASFGRVESHCFGCESVFDGPQPQSIAEQVFQKLVAKDPRNPRVHYLQGYLLEEQGRYADALPKFRTAVQIDGDYLNAWRHLNQIGTHIHLDAADRDVVTLKLLELDPEQRHVNYDVSAAGDFTQLWGAVAEARRSHGQEADDAPLYQLAASARRLDQKQSALPPELRQQIEQYQTMLSSARQHQRLQSPPIVLGSHRLLIQIGQLIAVDGGPDLPGEE